MPMNPDHLYGLTFLDNSREKSNFQIHMDAITALNIADKLADMGDLRTAVEGITLGTVIGDKWVGDITKYAETLPASVEAQREKKWLVRYQDDVNLSIYTVEIPTADLSLLQPNSDLMVIDAGAGLTFVTAFEALATSPEGNPVTVLDVRYVGRSL